MTSRSPAVRLSILALLAAVFALVWWTAAALEINSVDELTARVREPVDDLGVLRWPIALVVATLLLVALVASPIVFAACGVVLGAAGGLVVALTALGLAVLIERQLGRTLFGEWLQQRMAPRWPHLDSTISRYGFPGVMAVRLVGAPPALLGWMSSATSLRAWQIALGCVLGTVPRGFAYVSLGASGAQLWPPSEWTPLVFISGAVLALVGVASMVVAARIRPTDERGES